MIELVDGMILYHGSFVEVREPDLEKCALYKDFGKGFYLTTSKEQAISFAKLSTSKAKAAGKIDINQKYGIVSSYRLNNVDSLKSHLYADADKDWLHCVVAHRKKGTFDQIVADMNSFDLIGGKIADDATNATINAYMAETFGAIGSERADQICIELLLPNRLQDQYCFRSNLAIGCLDFIESEKVWMKE